MPNQTASLPAVIETAVALTHALIAQLNRQTDLLTSDQGAAAQADNNGLTKAHAQAMSKLQALSAHCQPNQDELQALIALQKLDNELTLAKLNVLLAATPDSIEQRYHRAVTLAQLGRNDEGQADFLAVLQQQPNHLGALIDFGNLLLNTGYRSAARTLYSQAVQCYPDCVMGHVNLANILLSETDYAAAKRHFQAALAQAPDLAEAHQGLSYVLHALGDTDNAQQHREHGFKGQALMHWPQRGAKPATPLLILCSALGGNIAFKHLLDAQIFDATLLFAEYFDHKAPLPRHQLAINAMGDADLCTAGLRAAEAFLVGTDKPVINPPRLVQPTGRLENAERLGRLPGVITARTRLLGKDGLLSANAAQILAQHGLSFPLLLRSPGYHTGQHFLCAESISALHRVTAALPGDALLVMDKLNARNPDGDYLKYRVMYVDGRLYPLHMAVSMQWKVHYFSADMEIQPAAQALERAFLEDMPAVLGNKALAALENIGQTLGLDYAGADFALNENQEVLLFEANATMIIPSPPAEPQWAYRRAAIDKLRAAVQDMIIKRAAS
ncbi:MAG: tetratricopeptide repeat protein [Methylomonas sp.]|jgi:tetratricopeptide (TPR) repeat protein